MLYAYSGPHTIPLLMLIDKKIFSIIIGDMMFHPESLDRTTRLRLLEVFVPTLDS